MSKAAELAKWGEVSTNGQVSGRRNIVINGAMQVNQRGTTDAANGNGFPVDRFKCTVAALDQFVVALSQDSSAPVGFANSLEIEVTTIEDALATNETFVLETRIESQDLLQVQKGTATAKTMSLTFYVKSSVTGNYALQALDHDNNRSVAFLYAISVADTWEKKSILIPADTTGAFADDNGKGLALLWYLAAGTNFTSGTLQSAWAGTTNANLAAGHNVNIMSNTDNNWFLTGVQLEVGSVATPFEHRSFGEELALCQRYFQVAQSGTNAAISPICNGWQQSSSDTRGILKFSAMRVAPTIAQNTAANYFLFERNGASDLLTELSVAYSTPTSCLIYDDNTSSGTAGHGGGIYTNNASAYLHLLSEL